jgi:hypothetical protein
MYHPKEVYNYLVYKSLTDGLPDYSDIYQHLGQFY